MSCANWYSHSTASSIVDALAQVVVEQLGLLGADMLDDGQREVHVHRLVAEDPVGAGGEPVEQTLGPQEVHVGERGEEEETFDARGEADEIEEELLA
jgi:hypothetical protein